MHYPRRKAGCLLVANTDKISAKLYHHGKRNAFHCCSAQRILRYAPWCGHSCFTDHKNLTFDTLKNVTDFMLAYKKLRVFTHTTLHQGPPQYSSQQLFKAPLPSYTGSDRGVEETPEPAEVSNEEEGEAYFLDQEYSGLYDEDVWQCIECYLNLPDTSHPDENSLNYAHICELQQQDEQLLALQAKYPDNCQLTTG
jgi:hypothetical protein